MSDDDEKALLSSMMCGGDAIVSQVVDRIGADAEDWLTVPACRTIYALLVENWAKGVSFDLAQFTIELRKRGALDKIGGPAFVTEVNYFAPGTGINFAYYLSNLEDARWIRTVGEAGRNLTKAAGAKHADAKEVREFAEKELQRLTSRGTQGKRRNIKEIVGDVIDSMHTPEKLVGISSGYASMDAIIGGFAPGEKIVVAGGTSSGKSALMACFAVSLSVVRGIPAAIFTFEMNANQTVERILQIHARVSVRGELLGPDIDAFRSQEFLTASRYVEQAPLFVINERMDIAGIRARCLQLKAAHGLRVAFIDYLQIVPEKKERGEGTTEKFDRMSAETKQIADNLGITVIEGSQLTVDEKSGKTTTRWSAGITNDADKLLVIQGADDEEKDRIEKEIIVAKQRNGPKGRVAFTFHKPTTRFIEKKPLK